MCVTWNDQQWLTNSQPEKPGSRYTLTDTFYNASGEVARIYSETDGSFWGVLPGEGRYSNLYNTTNESAHTKALKMLSDAGFTLTEPTTPVAEVIAAAEASLLADLVENLA